MHCLPYLLVALVAGFFGFVIGFTTYDYCEQGQWKQPTLEQIQWRVGQPPVWDDYDRSGQSWHWVVNDRGEWKFRRFKRPSNYTVEE